MSNTKIRIYKGDIAIAWIEVPDENYDAFNQAFSHFDGKLVPVINMVDEDMRNDKTGEWQDRGEFQKVMSFDLLSKQRH